MSVLVAGVYAGTSGTASAAPSPRLVRAAHEFEGQMMKELLKPLTDSDGLTGSSAADGSDSALGEFAAESLAQGISQEGGFGIASKILGDLSHFSNQPASGTVTRNLHANTVLRESL